MPCSPGMRACRTDCAHRALVRDYQQERERQEIAAENDWRHRDGNDQADPLITFQQWLVGSARRDEAAA